MPLHATEHEFLLVVLREHGDGLGVSQVGLARRLGTTSRYVSKVEAGQWRLDVREFCECREGLSVDSRTVYDDFCSVMKVRRQLWDAQTGRGLPWERVSLVKY
jgi:transcriptional regulator with XRE-family HTH domain